MVNYRNILFSSLVWASFVPNALAATWWPWDGHEYTLVDTQRSWQAAQDYAADVLSADPDGQYANGPTYLVCINSATEEAFLQGQFGIPAHGCWIGGYQDLNAPDYSEPAGGWRWISGESFGAYTNWKEGEPNNQGQENFINWGCNGPLTWWNDQYDGPRISIVERVPEPESDFDADAEGWQAIEFLDNDTDYASIFNGPLDVNWEPNDGVPAPCAKFTEPDWFGQTFYFAVPLKFLGNRRDIASLDWSIKTDPGGDWEQPDVVLWGLVGGVRLVLVSSLPPQANSKWQHLWVSLRSAAQWRVGTSTGPVATREQVEDVTETLEGLFIRGEFRSGVDTSWIDEVHYTLVGDLTCDGNIDFGDINPFVLALSDPAGYSATYPSCNMLTADINGDGLVNFGDINPFVELLSAQ